MKTDVIAVSARGNRIGEALELVDKVTAYKGLSGKNALHLRLLAEEMMGLMRSVTGAEEGLFWVEDNDQDYELHLQVKTRLSGESREKLLTVSSSGKNEYAKGLMGRIRDFFDWGSDEDAEYFSSSLLTPELLEHNSSPTLNYEWSMLRYEEQLAARVRAEDPTAREAWDEIEKSVVAHVADEIKVSIRGRTVEMTILKKMT